MSGCLLDTNAVIVALSDPDRLSRPMRKAITAGDNVISVISYWEVILKSMKGALDIGQPRVWWATALEHLIARPLPLRPNHVSTLYELPPIHKDPFDRMLIAQAATEDLCLVTADSEVQKYRSERLRIIS